MLRSQLSAPMDSYLDSHIDPRSLTRGLLGLVILLMLSAWPRTALAQTGVSDDRVSLPEGPGSLEGVGENVEIDPNMGQMRYGVSIKVPSGYPGMTPALALSYSSGAGGSVVGMGWSLAMPNIERTTARGLPDYDVDDEFAANGSDQLVRVSNGPEPVYRARFEKAFIRYKWHDRGDGSEGYWTAEHPDGRISYYGATSDGTLVDSARVSGITGTFRYHLVETVDPYGHKLVYDYSLFGGNVTLLQHIGWVFDDGQPVYEASFQYSDRSDLLSDCKAGFNELLSKRLDRINVLAHGTRIRYYALTYEDYASSGGFSRLTAVQMYGKDGNPYPVHETFSYSQGLGAQCDGSDCQKPYMTSMGSIGGGLGAGKAALIDLNGDALPDIVDASQPGAHRIHLNQLAADGSHSFAAPFDSAVGTQASHGLGGSAYVQVLDADGDGRTDMLNVQTGQILKNLGDGDWDAQVVSLWDSNNIPFSEAEMATMHFIDYDNDKRIDLIRSQGSGLTNITTVYRNTESGAFVVDTNVEDIGAGFDTDKIELNDMNGDGLLDAVQVSLSEVRFWLNLGKGRWDAQATIPNVSFTDIAQATRAELEDLNGDALADLVLVEGNEIKYWLNRNGASFDPVQTVVSANVDGELPVRDATTVVLFADMNGNGSSDVVWIDATGNVNYLELFPVRPNLMSKIENGLGKISTITYGTSVMDMARDKELGEPWSHALPSPMMVVERYDEWNALTDIHETTDYLYHEGFYDGLEKQFRGFIRVEQLEPGDSTSEEGHLYEVYDVGVDDPYRNGLLLSSEIQGEAGRSLQMSQITYDDCDLNGVPATGLTFDVRHICKTSELVEHREGRPASEWMTTETRYTYDGYGNVSLESKLGVTQVGGGACQACTESGYTGTPCGPQCLGDEAYIRSEYIQPESNDDRWLLRLLVHQQGFGESTAQGEPASNFYSETSQYYDGEAFTGLPLGQATHGTVTRVVVRKDSSDETYEPTRNRVDEHGNVVESLDPLGSSGSDTHRRLWTMDALGLDVIRSEVLLRDDLGPYRLQRDMVYDPLFRKAIEASNWVLMRNGADASERSVLQWTYDEFARVNSATKPEESAGFTTEEYSWTLGNPFSSARIQSRSQAGGSLDFEQVQCFDGLGRKYQERIKIAPGQYKVTGYTIFDTKGEEIKEFQPYRSTSGQCDLIPPDDVDSITNYFDALGRVTQQTLPDVDQDDGEETFTRTEFRPLSEIHYDLEDTFQQGPHHDTPTTSFSNGNGQTIRRTLSLTASGAPLTYSFSWDPLGNVSAVTDPEGNKRAQRFDTRGNCLESDDPDRGVTHYAYDDAGNMVRREDARGVVTLSTYDGYNRKIAEWDQADEAGSKIEYRFDSPGDCPTDLCSNVSGRLVSSSYPLSAGTRGEDRSGYSPNGKTTYASRFIDGQLYEIRSQYDNLDRLTSEILPTGLQIDYHLNGEGKVQSIPGYINSISYAPRGGISEMDLDNGVTVSYGYDRQMRLAEIQAIGPSADTIVAYTYQRDRQGNILTITDGRADDAHPLGNANYSYDALYRLTTAELDAGRSAHAETLNYAYDKIDNMVSKTSSLGESSPAHVGTMTYGGQGAGPHALTLAGDVSYSYDDAGFLIARGDDTFGWDFRGRLAQSSTGMGEQAQYLYSSGSDRVAKIEGGQVSHYVSSHFEVREGVATSYLLLGETRVVKIEEPSFASQVYSDLAPASETSSVLTSTPDEQINAADAWLAQGLGTNVFTLDDATVAVSPVEQLLEVSLKRMLEGEASRVRFLHQDHLGGTVAITDESGQVIERHEYYPYGSERYASESHNNYGFSGKERDALSGLHYFGGRYYDSVVGRWISVDPHFATLGGDDLDGSREASCGYAYVLNNPVGNVDPSGEWVMGVVSAVTTMIAEPFIGAASGAAAALAAVKIDNHYSDSPISAKKQAVAVGIGAAAGGITGLVGGLIGGVVGIATAWLPDGPDMIGPAIGITLATSLATAVAGIVGGIAGQIATIKAHKAMDAKSTATKTKANAGVSAPDSKRTSPNRPLPKPPGVSKKKVKPTKALPRVPRSARSKKKIRSKARGNLRKMSRPKKPLPSRSAKNPKTSRAS